MSFKGGPGGECVKGHNVIHEAYVITSLLLLFAWELIACARSSYCVYKLFIFLMENGSL
jgi:hypothetical protein